MANFNMQITNKGRALLAKAQAGATLTFTRMRIGSGTLTGQQIADLNGLIDPKLWLSLNKSMPSETGRYTVGAYLSNENITTGFYFREWGLFAQDPDLGEILYSYGNVGAGAEYISAGGGSDIVEKQLDAIMIIGNASNVTAVLDESLVFTNRSEFDSHKDNTNVHVNKNGSLQTNLNVEIWNGWKVFNSWSSLGITTLESFQQILDVMPNHSILSMPFSGGTATTVGLNGKVGHIFVSKPQAGRYLIFAQCTTGDFYTPKYTGVGTFEGWKKQAIADGVLQTNLNAEFVNGFKVFKSIAELSGLSASPTMDEIVSAMPIGSILYTVMNNTTSINLGLPFNFGTLEVIKTASSRVKAFAYKAASQEVYKASFSTATNAVFISWIKDPDADGTLQVNLNTEMVNGWRKYGDITEIGLTDQTATMPAILAAMPVRSVMIISINSYNSAGLGVGFASGLLEVYKRGSTRAIARASNGAGKVLNGIIDNNGNWINWKTYAIADGSLQSGLNSELLGGYQASEIMTPIATTTGTSLAYNATFSPAFAKVDGRTIRIRAHLTSSVPCTLNANGTGAAQIKRSNGKFARLEANGIYTLTWDANQGAFILQAEGSDSTELAVLDTVKVDTLYPSWQSVGINATNLITLNYLGSYEGFENANWLIEFMDENVLDIADFTVTDGTGLSLVCRAGKYLKGEANGTLLAEAYKGSDFLNISIEKINNFEVQLRIESDSTIFLSPLYVPRFLRLRTTVL